MYRLQPAGAGRCWASGIRLNRNALGVVDEKQPKI